MKILMSHFSFYRKNGWGRIFEEAKGLALLGHDVTVFCGHLKKGFGYEQKVEENVKIVCFKDVIATKRLYGGYGFISLINKCIYSFFHRFDICLSDAHRPNAFLPCLFDRFFGNSRLFVEWWDDFSVKADRLSPRNPITKYRIKCDLKREISSKKKADGVITLSALLASKAEAIGIDRDRITIVHGGCDTIHLPFNPINTGKNILAIDNNTLTFGFIGGGDVEMVDLKVFFDAVLELKDKYRIKFLNFGQPFAKATLNNPQMKDLIIECGWIDYYGDNAILSAVDVFVLIKQDNVENNSGWPNKFGDYLALGRAVMVNPYGELVEFSEQWKPGILSVKYTKESIVGTIIDIFEGKFDLNVLAKTNREIAEQNTWLHKAHELESFFMSSVRKN